MRAGVAASIVSGSLPSASDSILAVYSWKVSFIRGTPVVILRSGFQHPSATPAVALLTIALLAISSSSMWPIIREAIAGARPEVRRQMRWIVVFWIVMVALQIWDSRNGRGAGGVAEFLSALLGASGVALLGFAHMLNLTMQDSPGRRGPSHQEEAVRRVLLALPAIGF